MHRLNCMYAAAPFPQNIIRTIGKTAKCIVPFCIFSTSKKKWKQPKSYSIELKCFILVRRFYAEQYKKLETEKTFSAMSMIYIYAPTTKMNRPTGKWIENVAHSYLVNIVYQFNNFVCFHCWLCLFSTSLVIIFTVARAHGLCNNAVILAVHSAL